jgi:hypothetical protein
LAKNNLVRQLRGKEQEILALTSKLAEFFEHEKVTPPLALGCLAETVNRLTTSYTKDLQDPEAIHALAEQMAGIFIHAIVHSLQTQLQEKFNQTSSLKLETPDDIAFLAPVSGHA